MAPFPTQDIIHIAGIKEGIVILRDGGYRIILQVSTVNFALKSEQEQNSLIFQYQSFLNSLHFPIQIIMRSKRLDLNMYLKKIGKLVEKQESELLKIQTQDYIDFVGKLIDLANIMKKTFYVVVPFNPMVVANPSLIQKLFGNFSKNKQPTVSELKISEDEFKRNSQELRERAKVVASGLAGMGLHCVQLSTEEIIELFYQIYNPEIASKELFEDAEQLAAPVIQHVSEKKGVEQPQSAEVKSEEIIDNTAEVASVQQAQVTQRQIEAEKEAEKQPAVERIKEQTEGETPKIPNKPPAQVTVPVSAQAPQAPQPPVKEKPEVTP